MAALWRPDPVARVADRRDAHLWLREVAEAAGAYLRGAKGYRPSVEDLTEDHLYTVIGGCCITGERRRHWRERHPEVTAEAESVMLPRAILSPQHESPDPKVCDTVRRYAQADDGHWWRVVVKMGPEPFVLTFHRVQRPGR